MLKQFESLGEVETLPKVIEDTIFFVLPRNNRIGKSKFNNVSVGELALTISREIVERERESEREGGRERLREWQLRRLTWQL